MTLVMKCGHTALGRKRDGSPVCPMCVGIDPRAEIVDDNPPVLDGRMAVCPYCKRERASDYGLPFFEHRPTRDTDSYYCGCRGWE